MLNGVLYWYIFVLLALIILFILKRYYVGSGPRLPVLLYHKVSATDYNDKQTITVASLEAQFKYLLTEGYTPVFLNELIKYVHYQKPLPRKPVLISFDGGYRDNYTIMYPLLKSYGMKVNIFLVPSLLQDGYDQFNDNSDEYLRVRDINAIDPQLVEFGFQPFDNKNYQLLSIEEINDIIVKSKELLTAMKVPFQPCIAFANGTFPSLNAGKRRQLLTTLANNKIALAFLTGNRLNDLPLKNHLLIQRLEVKGDGSFKEFVRMLKPLLR